MRFQQQGELSDMLYVHRVSDFVWCLTASLVRKCKERFCMILYDSDSVSVLKVLKILASIPGFPPTCFHYECCSLSFLYNFLLLPFCFLNLCNKWMMLSLWSRSGFFFRNWVHVSKYTELSGKEGIMLEHWPFLNRWRKASEIIVEVYSFKQDFLEKKKGEQFYFKSSILKLCVAKTL